MIFQNKTHFHIGKNEIQSKALMSELSRSMHVQVVGATGTGKTESFLLPLAFKEMQLGKAVIFLDPKGDSNTFQTFVRLAELSGRVQNLEILNLSKPCVSQKYNPLSLGSPTELKDKIVGSIIWTEEFYKKVAEKTLLDIFLLFSKAKVVSTLTSLDCLLNSPDLFVFPSGNAEVGEELELLKNSLKKNGNDLAGLRSDIALWAKSEFSDLLSNPAAASALDWIQNKKLVYINLSVLKFEETSRRFGRLLIQDLKSAVQRIQELDEVLRPKTLVILDEFASVASSGFIELLNKARSANVSLILAHQSLGDLNAISESFTDQVLDNTPNKVIFRVDSPDTADFLSRLIGTRKVAKRTYQTQNSGVLGDSDTGMGSVRETDEFYVSPNVLKSLDRGQAIVVTKIPFKISKVRLITAKKRISTHGGNKWKNLFLN